MKKTLLILSLGLMMAVSAKAQIFVMEDESSLRDPSVPVSEWPVLPQNEGQGNDSYTPVGGGIFLFTVLGGAYLFEKKKENKENK